MIILPELWRILLSTRWIELQAELMFKYDFSKNRPPYPCYPTRPESFKPMFKDQLLYTLATNSGKIFNLRFFFFYKSTTTVFP
jgi:hypothetical protein